MNYLEAIDFVSPPANAIRDVLYHAAKDMIWRVRFVSPMDFNILEATPIYNIQNCLYYTRINDELRFSYRIGTKDIEIIYA